MPDIATLVQSLVSRAAEARETSDRDPFDNPVRDMSLTLSGMMDEGTLDAALLREMILKLRDDAYHARAGRLARYVGGTGEEGSQAAMSALAHRLAAGSLDAFRAETERTRFTAVFTAHPTFSMPPEVAHELAVMASGGPAPPPRPSHRPKKPSLSEEFDQAMAAMQAGRDAIDRLSRALLEAARDKWPENWTALAPRPIVLASWVGYDTDGRTDVNWWDTFRLRLRMKAMQLERIAGQVAPFPSAAELHERLVAARDAVEAQIAACPAGTVAEPDAVADFARALIEGRETALVSVAPLVPLFESAIAAAPDEAKMALCVARIGLVAHGLSLAHTQFRLNAAQLHNTLRQQAGLDDPVADTSRRRAMLAAINAALDKVAPVQVDFGSLLAESASAMRLMMTLAQIVKHVDGDARLRFHVAETESGYTMLCALWLARLFGIEDKVEISPLFETAEALERGSRILDEALRSPHWRDYLRRVGVLALEFGYSDSGRYVGQLAASYLIERQRLKIAEVLAQHRVTGVEIILFDTHGESIGRGSHPGFLLDRLKFLNPTRSRKELTRAGLIVREESAFQGGDGYLLFGTQALAFATVARIAEHTFDEDARPDARRLPLDPIYDDPDFAADFFGTMRVAMEALVEDPGYAALLGTFGPALLDPTGSRPSARQIDGLGGPARISHPRELRAIPNNAIVQQLGWCANTLHGLGAALDRHQQGFHEFMKSSPRFRRAIDFAEHALRHSDLDVLRGIISMLDPGSWLDRARHGAEGRHGSAFVLISTALESFDISAACQIMLRRVQKDDLALRRVWRDAPAMQPEEMLLHAIRLALIQQIWLLAVRIPDFSPRHGVTRQALVTRLLRLDVPATLEVLAGIFPAQTDAASERDYSEPRGLRALGAYERENETLFRPMADLFALVREIGSVIVHDIGAFG